MRIKLDNKHWLNSDQYCFWITQEQKVRSGKTKGEIAEVRVSGYHGHISDVVASFIDAKIGRSEAESWQELADEIENLKKTVKKWKPKVERVK